MEGLYINSTSLDKGYNYSNITSDYYNNRNGIFDFYYDSNITSEYYDYNNYYDYYNYYHYYYNNFDSDYDNDEAVSITYVVTCIIISIGLPLTLIAICALCSLVRNDHVAPIYVINLLISDLIQLCCMIAVVNQHEHWKKPKLVFYIYVYGVMSSVGFMVCVAMERYLIIACPLWYRFRRTIKVSVVVCVVVWALPLVFLLPFYVWVDFQARKTIFAIFLLLPFPLLIFFLGGTLKALSASISVPSDEKRRIVGLLVLVLLIYMLLFLPSIIFPLAKEVRHNKTLQSLSFMLVKLSPLADLALYVLMRKGTTDTLLASVCCSGMDSNEISRSTV